MMTGRDPGADGQNVIPLPALVLGVAGLIPFFWAVVVVHTGFLAIEAVPAWPAASSYGLMIFCYMSGCFWPFAVRAGRPLDYVLAVAPVLVMIALVTSGFLPLVLALILGFPGLLIVDWHFARQGAAPVWWMRLRMPLTAAVTCCLILVVLPAMLGAA